ncbi:LTA synthase family protein [Lacticigenium naphthae]|uniref:LTA synthase family protein n=1 Tax=Lacticigenium naphthae TaxID=515351 RepID=UPI00041B1141|nr:alkaline phosphatase family protein [Lacticigenium naphthae]
MQFISVKQNSLLPITGLKIILFIALHFLITFFLQLLHFNFEKELISNFFSIENTSIILAQTFILIWIGLWLFSITRSLLLATIINTVFFLLMGVANQQKIQYRSEPLYPSDIYFLKDINFVLDMVEPIYLVALILIVTFITGVFIYILMSKNKRSADHKYKIFRLVSIIILTYGLFYMSNFNKPGNAIKEFFSNHTSWVMFNQHSNYSKNGVIVGFLFNLKSPAMQEPGGYSEKKVEEIINKYKKQSIATNEDRVTNLDDMNIVYVMNETFSDPLYYDGLSVNQDPISDFRNLENFGNISWVYTPAYGGGTANVEFEALTGISLEPLSANITTPYIQLAKEIESYPSILSLVGDKYDRLAIHPYNTNLYKRKEVYEGLGFDQFLDHHTMEYTERIENNEFISDESAYKEVIKTIEGNQKPSFIHLVTMQNHQPYLGKYDNLLFEVEGTPDNIETAHYMNDLYYSSLALKDFISKLENSPEKTVVFFWGDHLPSLYGDDVYGSNGKTKMHKTPLYMYSNFSEIGAVPDTISPIYFMNHIYSLNNSKVSPYIQLLMSLEEHIPVISNGTYYSEKKSEYYNRREELPVAAQELLNDYDIILYDITTGANYSSKLGLYN